MAIIEDHDGHSVLVHYVNGNRYSFSVECVPKEKHQWLCDVIGKHMDEIYETTKRDTENSVKKNIREALGL